MDGQGPTNGSPYPFGVVAGAEDALTLDFWLCRMMGVRLEDYPLWQAAAARGKPQCRLREEDLAGDFSAAHVWKGLDIRKLDSLSVLPLLPALFRLPFGRFLERALTSRPVHVPSRCLGAGRCGKCAAVCGAKAIEPDAESGKRLKFDYKKCIRCYCCHEMCPAGAIEFKEGLWMKASRWLNRRRNEKRARAR
jgi:ferredoxin